MAPRVAEPEGGFYYALQGLQPKKGEHPHPGRSGLGVTKPPVGAEGMHPVCPAEGIGQCPIKSNERQAGAKGSADRRICGLRLFVPDSRRAADLRPEVALPCGATPPPTY